MGNRCFNSLIGRLKTDSRSERYRSVSGVSIPYRQAENNQGLHSFDTVWFQFLIGRLKTQKLFPAINKKNNMFQFLIGRLKTQIAFLYIGFNVFVSIPYRQAENLDCVLRPVHIGEFQFLIGRLKTAQIVVWNFILVVSIPYRQAENVDNGAVVRVFGGMFQFLIGRLKTRQQQSFVAPYVPFQFLIGRLKTKFRFF